MHSILSLVDFTNLDTNADESGIETLCLNANEYNVAAICVYPQWLSFSKEKLANNIKLATVCNFPTGESDCATVLDEINVAIAAGADEIDIVINRGYVLQNNWKKLYDEVRSFKETAGKTKIKAILGVGDLETLRNVAKASLVCMMAGADFIKTSTGKESINANLNNSLVMLRMIRDFHTKTGKKIGFKPAGGISTAKSVLEFLILVAEELGFEWVNPKLLRIGASSLLIDIERQLYHYTSGRYANKEKLAIG